jgi:5-methylcytosine-specific restriction endonuclease McrA
MMSDNKAALNAAIQKFYFSEEIPPLPVPKPKSQWEPANKFGFFSAVVEHGKEEHALQLLELLEKEQFEKQQLFASEGDEPNFIDVLFNYYIQPFHKNYSSNESRRESPRSSAAGKTSRPNSAKKKKTSRASSAASDHVSYSDSSISKFSESLLARDKVCLFCWSPEKLQRAHIIAKKNTGIPMDEEELLQRAGLEHKNAVQNGLVLCMSCHDDFDLLESYVDPGPRGVETKFVLNILDQSYNDCKFLTLKL